MLNPVWLKSLVAIVQTGSFQSAARALGLAQPTVSQHLQKLEEQVGVTLVQRSRSGCQPTTRALAFMPHATALLDMHARALEALHGNRERVGASSNIGTYLLQPFVRNYLTTANERGEVDLRIAANPDVADQLLAGQLDAAIMDGRDRKAGAVAGVTHTRSPISLARKVMEGSPHVFMAGDGANAFAKDSGLEQVDPSYFRTEERWQQL